MNLKKTTWIWNERDQRRNEIKVITLSEKWRRRRQTNMEMW